MKLQRLEDLRNQVKTTRQVYIESIEKSILQALQVGADYVYLDCDDFIIELLEESDYGYEYIEGGFFGWDCIRVEL